MAIRSIGETLIDVEDNLKIANLFGTSEDVKPTTGYANGSLFMEVDTGKIYAFNESTTSWTEV